MTNRANDLQDSNPPVTITFRRIRPSKQELRSRALASANLALTATNGLLYCIATFALGPWLLKQEEDVLWILGLGALAEALIWLGVFAHVRYNKA